MFEEAYFNLAFPFPLKICELFYPLFGFAFIYKSSKNNFLLNSFIFIIPFFIKVLTGYRGEFFAIFVTIIFIYSSYFKILKWRKIIPLGFILFLFLTFLGTSRFIENASIKDFLYDTSILELFIQALAFSGNSLGVLAYTIKFYDQFFNKVPFLIGYIPALFSFAPNYTYEGLQAKDYLAQHLIYILNPEKLYSGSTIGTSIAAEFYEFSGGNNFVIFILSAIMLYLMMYFLKNLFINQLFFYVGAVYIQNLLLSPRNSIMKVFNKETIISFFILYLIVFLSKKKTNLIN